ncbi:hypothetical protein HC928_10930 [bacterium]|nr:hypothetical protein [bacterium]
MTLQTKTKMPQISYSTKTEEWDTYFKRQADMQKGERSWQKNKIVYANASVGGGISSLASIAGLTRVGLFKDARAKTKEDNEVIEVKIVSPIEATADQAQSELENIIKEGDHAEASISKETTKRASSLDGPPPSEKKKQKVEYKDIFSKKTTRK